MFRRVRLSMFIRRLQITYANSEGIVTLCPIKWLDSFAMRNFTNDAIFDDTLPLADGLMEAGLRIPLDLLRERMEDWFRRKGYLAPKDTIQIRDVILSNAKDPGALMSAKI